MHITPIKPSGITLLATLRCTAACDNCCFGCNPKQGRSMTFEEMKDYVDKSLEAYPDSITKLCLTGGECMLLGKEVDKIISYAQSKGLNASIVSNAYWATDYDKAYRTLKRLKNKGLTSACFSTGEDHNRYVPWMNVRHAAVAAARLGIVSNLRVENQLLHTEIIHELNADEEVTELVSQYKLQISTPYWMEYDNNDKKSRHLKMRLMDSEEKLPCNYLFQDIIINPYGEIYACCGIGVCHIPQMRLGNIHQEPIQTIYERAFEDVLKIWLYTEGPQDVLEFVKKKTGQKFNWHTRHNCDICRSIFTDKSILPILRDNVFEATSLPLLFYHLKPKQKMKDEPNNKKHLTPRQIINRYRKGVYVDESIEVISSVISSCGKTFDSTAVAFPTTLAEKVLENLTTAQLLYEKQAAGQPIDDIAIDDYPRLKDILQDLTYPPLWESMHKDKEDNDFMDILNERGWIHKYHVADDQSSKALNCMTSLYRDAIEKAGLSSSTFYIVLHFML